MDSITLLRPVTVKVRVTEQFKDGMVFELEQQIDRLDNEIQQLEFQIKRMRLELANNTIGASAAQQKHEMEKQRRQESKARLTEQLNNMENMPIGSEILNSSIQGIVEIKVGDDWDRVLGAEVIVEDSKVVEIREVAVE